MNGHYGDQIAVEAIRCGMDAIPFVKSYQSFPIHSRVVLPQLLLLVRELRLRGIPFLSLPKPPHLHHLGIPHHSGLRFARGHDRYDHLLARVARITFLYSEYLEHMS
jgi:hypothetical protein